MMLVAFKIDALAAPFTRGFRNWKAFAKADWICLGGHCAMHVAAFYLQVALCPRFMMLRPRSITDAGSQRSLYELASKHSGSWKREMAIKPSEQSAWHQVACSLSAKCVDKDEQAAATVAPNACGQL